MLLIVKHCVKKMGNNKIFSLCSLRDLSEVQERDAQPNLRLCEVYFYSMKMCLGTLGSDELTLTKEAPWKKMGSGEALEEKCVLGRSSSFSKGPALGHTGHEWEQ